jgi:hypothetical protein
MKNDPIKPDLLRMEATVQTQTNWLDVLPGLDKLPQRYSMQQLRLYFAVFQKAGVVNQPN